MLSGKTHKIKGWSQAGLVAFFKTEVLNLCGGSSNCSTHTGFMLPTNTAEESATPERKTHCDPESNYKFIYKSFDS